MVLDKVGKVGMDFCVRQARIHVDTRKQTDFSLSFLSFFFFSIEKERQRNKSLTHILSHPTL